MRKMLDLLLSTMALVSVLALPAVLEAQAGCSPTCKECEYNPSGTVCYDSCRDGVCHYVSCDCKPDDT